jgi:ATP-dependent Clp protease ATP-binding subunit ClpA
MDDFVFPVWMLLQVLENRLALVEGLGFPEIARLGGTRDRLRDEIQRNLRRLVEAAPLPSLHRRHLASAPTVGAVELTVDPQPGSILWREPLPLAFPVVRWRHGSDAELALVPALGIEVVAGKAAELDQRLPDEIRAALSRGPALSLQFLVALQRVLRIRVEPLRVKVRVRSAKVRAVAAEREREERPSELEQVATDLTRGEAEPTFGLDPIVAQLAELFTARHPRGVLLVGPAGVGKTATVRELVRQRAAHNLGSTPFWATSGARLVAGMSGYGMWQERCQQVIREASRRRAIVHLGNLVELMEVGKSEHNAMGIATFLRPSLARGSLLAIAECTPEQLPVIERGDPHLLGVFQQLTVSEPDAALGRAILKDAADRAVRTAAEPRPPLPADSLAVLDSLHRRYGTYSAYPGRPLRFLHNLLKDHPAGVAVTPADVLAAFTRETGLPRVLLDPAAPLDLERTRGWFKERVVGQSEAVELIVDLLATTKAGLTRPRKPIASLVFIGPTGVGKTEMAKTLAEFLFGSRQRLTRFDMSEFGDPVSVQRLVGGVFGSEGLLTAKVREQPFSVLLLDEFEKAHPLFLDLLLQVLGEGRLTDAAGRLADFCNTVVILTSNLGAESYQQGAFGFASEPASRGHEAAEAARREAARGHFLRAVQAHVRPELFNRIDRLVPFAPLAASTVHRIAERHLGRLEARDGIRYRGVTLRLGAGVAAHLARNGYDARYGARPLLRTVERELLAPLADGMNRYNAELALDVGVNLAGTALQVTVKPRTDAAGRPLAAATSEAPLVEAAGQSAELRRQVQRLERSLCVRELNNELFQLEKDQKRFDKSQQRHAAKLASASSEARRQRLLANAPRMSAADQQRMTRLARLGEIAGRLRDLATRSCGLEDEALQALYAGFGADVFALGDLTAAVEPLRQDWYDLLLTFYCRQFPDPDRLTLALFSEERDCLIELAAAYAGVARQQRLRIELLAFRLPAGPRSGPVLGAPRAAEPLIAEPDEGSEEPSTQFWRQDHLIAAATARQPEWEVLTRWWTADIDKLLADPPARLLGLALHLRGAAAAPRFAPETGRHVFRGSRSAQTGECLVEISEADLTAYLPPAGIARRGAIGTQPQRRAYDRVQQVLEDALLKKRIPWQNRPLPAVLVVAIEERLRRSLLELLEE